MLDSWRCMSCLCRSPELTGQPRMPRKKMTARQYCNAQPPKATATKSCKADSKGGPAAASAPKPPRRYRPGTQALRGIQKIQRSTDVLIRELPFQRLIKETAIDIVPGIRFQSSAVGALQQASEAYLTGH
eukprot:contig_3806_g833